MDGTCSIRTKHLTHTYRCALSLASHAEHPRQCLGKRISTTCPKRSQLLISLAWFHDTIIDKYVTFQFDKKSKLGIDIGTASIKIVELAKRVKSFQLMNYGMYELEPETRSINFPIKTSCKVSRSAQKPESK